MAKQVYTLTPEDLKLFAEARHDASLFTSYYIRTPEMPVEQGWRFDHQIANPWQKDFCHAEQTDLVVVAGMGAGKTLGSVMAMLYWATLTPDFKGLHVAPTGWQAKQGYDALIQWLLGSIYAERFLWNAVTKPYPKIEIRYRLPDAVDPQTGKSRKGREIYSTLEFMSSADDAGRIKTWEGDWVNHDQAEMIESIGDTIVSLGTRVRGNIRGRKRLGRLSWIANSDDNPELWWLFDQAQRHPDTNASWLRSTYDNRNLDERQVASFERRLGHDPAKIAQHLKGQRPAPQGEEFKAELMECVYDDSLDVVMARHRDDPGFALGTDEHAGVVLWQMPPDRERDYVVCGDPGQGTAPGRNAPVVFVLDITDYPTGPAVLRAFWWGDGAGKYEPWQNRMLEWIALYRAKAAAYDATGGQKLHTETTFRDSTLVQPIDLSGVKKSLYMNALKIIFQRGRVKLPRGIGGLVTQFGKYRLPDAKLAQDIVSAFLVLAGLLWALGLDDEEFDRDGDGVACSTCGHQDLRGAQFCCSCGDALPIVRWTTQDRYRRTRGIGDRFSRSHERVGADIFIAHHRPLPRK